MGLVAAPGKITMAMYDVLSIIRSNKKIQLNDPNFVEIAINETQKIADHIEKNFFPSIETNNEKKGSINVFGSNKLIVRQLPEVHEKIQAYLKDLQQTADKAVGRTEASPEEQKTQVSIACRFIEAGPDFLEEIGIDPTIYEGSKISHSKPLLDNETGIINPANSKCADTVLFDSLQRDFILRATRSDPQAKILTAPKVTVLDTETATMKTMSELMYISGYEEDPNNPGQFDEIIESLESGIKLELTPSLVNNSSDIDLRFNFESKQLIKFTDAVHESGKIFQLPEQMTTEMSSRVIIPNGKTYLTVTHKLPNSSTESSLDRYMILLITPKIAKPAEIE